jgi:NADP-dependent 3-hydroxy acid dehydrogenase YdfG
MGESLTGKVIVVTGASSGIGEATARMAAGHGAVIAMAARRSEKLNDIAKEIRSDGGKAEVFEADVSDEKTCRQLVKDVEDKLGAMVERKSGHIVNVSSVAGRAATANSAVYNASKWGVNAFTEALRHELVQGKTGIRTTLIEPGAVVTELVSHNRPEVQEAAKKRYEGVNKRLEAEDIARSIIYAISQPQHVNVNEILVRPTEQDG